MRELIYERGDGIDERYTRSNSHLKSLEWRGPLIHSSLSKHVKGHCETEETLQNNDEI